MAKSKQASNAATDPEKQSVEASDQTAEPKAEKKPQPLTTGLEDYGRWRTLYQNYQPPKNEKPFRRGRIWC